MPVGALSQTLPQDNTAPPVPAMQYAGPQQSQVGALSMMPGVDPTLMQLMNNAGPGPESPYAKQLSDTAQALLGQPSEFAGALSSASSNYDKAVMAKKSAIQRAMDRLSGLSNGQANLPLMAAAAGALQPTRTAGPGEMIGNALRAGQGEIERQRDIERQIAGSLSGLDISGAQTDIEGAQGQQANLEKRLSLADQAENQAGNIQARSDLANYRNRQGVLQYAGRIGAAEIGANKNRYKFLGNDPADATVGRYLDQTTGQTMAGPAARGTGAGGGGGVTEWKYNMWLSSHPGDSAGALDFASGHRHLPPEQMRASALSLASKELGAGADPNDINTRAQQIYDAVSSGFGDAPGGPPASSPAQAPTPAAGAPAPHANNMTPQDIQQSLANAKATIAKNPAARTAVIARLKAAGIDPAGL